MIGIAHGHGGAVLKFRGDALLLLFAGPGHQVRACSAASTMQLLIEETGETMSVDRNRCDTRNDILARDLRPRDFRAGSDRGTLADPYTATTINFVQRKEDIVCRPDRPRRRPGRGVAHRCEALER